MSAAPEQPPRAVDVPEAVLTAIEVALKSAYADGSVASDRASLDSIHRVHDHADDASIALHAAIATALREAKEQGAADTARLDWLEGRAFSLYRERDEDTGALVSYAVYVNGDARTRCGILGEGGVRVALDAARAAEPEPPVTREDA